MEEIAHKDTTTNKKRISIAGIVSAYFIYYSFTSTEWHFIDNINLIIHEAGHVLCMFFGDFIHILGGSLFQIAFPCMFVFYFYHKQDFFSASLVLFWVGQNVINVSVYASDAIKMELPLLGIEHDWNILLSKMHLLPYTNTIGTMLYSIGIALITIAIYFSFATSKAK